MRDIAEVLSELGRSDFRRKQKLSDQDLQYLHDRGIVAVRGHADDLVSKRLAPAHPKNDGKQTPWRGHPVFTAQHATATCCRGCLAKWHHIEKGRELTRPEIDYVVDVISAWLSRF